MHLVGPAETASEHAAAERRLVVMIGAVVFVDTMFYAVIAPLLPELAHELRLSKLSAGVMTAAYPVGTLVGSLPSGMLIVRLGPRPTVCTGLALLACSTIAFGFLQNAAALDIARFVEGVGGACSWAGGFAWIIAETPSQRRGAMIGRAVAAAIGGSLFGPVIGTIATVTGRPVLFVGVAVVAVLLIVRMRSLPSRHAPSEQGLGTLLSVLRRPDVAAGMWLVALPAIASGTINVLGPLRLHRLGAGAAVIGATFLAAAAVEAAITPAVGKLSDRRGRLVPLRGGLALATVGLACFTLPGTTAGLACLIVFAAAALGTFWAPAMAMLSDTAETYGVDQGFAAALINLAWAGGQILGSGGGGAIAKSTGDGIPMLVVAGLCAVTLAALTLAPRIAGHLRLSASDAVAPPAGSRSDP